jgi:menaquinone-dependent protoporphyrinogen oxidase
MSAILVAYATKNGSTREVAEAITAALLERGCEVNLRPAGQIRDSVVGSDLIVLGAPIYSGRWHGDAHRFLKRHRRELLQIPIAVYGMGPRDDNDDAWQRAREQLNNALAKHG